MEGYAYGNAYFWRGKVSSICIHVCLSLSKGWGREGVSYRFLISIIGSYG